MQFLRSVIFTTCFFLVTAAYGVVVLCLGMFLPYRSRWAIARSWAWVNLRMLDVICNLGFSVVGLEYLPSEPSIAMWKHSSTWETIAQAWICPKQVWVFKRELMWIPIVGWALRFMQPIAIDRSGGGNALRQVVNQGKERLASGCWIVIFPEGTRMKVGETRRYGLSGAVLASETGCKIIPIAHTAGYFWPRRGWLKKPGVIKVVIGKPVATHGREPQEINAEIQAWMEKTVSENAPK